MLTKNEERRNDITPNKNEATYMLLTNAVLLNILEWMPYETAKAELKTYNINLDIDSPILLIVAGIDQFEPDSNSHEQFLAMVEVERVFYKYLSKRFRCYNASDANKTMVWILQPFDSDESNLLFCKKSLEAIQEESQRTLKLSISVVYDDFINYEQIHNRYQHLLSILAQVFIQGDGQALTDSKFYINRHGNGSDDRSGIYLHNLESVRQFLATGNIEKFSEALHNVLYSQVSNNAVRRLTAYHAVCSIVLEFFERAGLNEEVFSQPNHFEIFKDYKGRSVFFQEMCGLVEEMIGRSRKLYSNRNSTLVQSIQNYIDANLAGDLSLQTVADAFFVNSAYLARMYKQRVGVTIGEWIEAKRIDLAKRMLLRNEYRISDIAKETGYISAAYFSRVFKKREGKSPKKWREEHY